MSTIITFPSIEAWPCNLQDMTLLDMLPNKCCSPEIKNRFRSHVSWGHLAHNHKYPAGPKKVHIVQFSQYAQSQNMGLRPVKFSGLYLPSIAHDIAQIQTIVPVESKEQPIVAWDKNDSIFDGGDALHIDPGLGKVLFVLAPFKAFDYPPHWQFLAEML